MTLIVPPFTEDTAKSKVQLAQELWNTRDPERVVLAYTEDSKWRNCAEFCFTAADCKVAATILTRFSGYFRGGVQP